MTGTMQWHVDPRQIDAYLLGALDPLRAASLERHVASCAHCRAEVAPRVDPASVARGWEQVRAVVERGRLPWPVRFARRLGLPEPTGVLLAATMSLRVAWLSSAFVALGFALAATLLADGEPWPFLLVAPLVPVLGVAAAYGPADDPFESLAVTTPHGRTRLVLTRAIAVLVAVLPAACLLGLLLPGAGWVAAAWLGPGLAMLPVLMALASFVGPRVAAPVLAIVWTLVVVGSARELSPTWAVEIAQQVVYALLAATCVAVLVVRSRRSHQIGVVL